MMELLNDPVCIAKCNSLCDTHVATQAEKKTSKNFQSKHIETENSIIKPVYTLLGISNPLTIKEIGTMMLLGFMVILFIISVTGFIIMWFTEYYNNTMLTKLILKKNSTTLKNWMDPSSRFDTLLKVHIFNYTNIEKYMSGIDDKIKVSDIGPLTYKEHTTKVNVLFNKNHTITFRDHRTYQFLPEKSTIAENTKFIVPNVPLLTAAVKVEKLNGIKKFAAIQIINNFNEASFKSISANNFLWGYRDKIVSLDIGTGSTHFGLLMNRNGTSADSLQISTGEDDIKKFSLINQFNGDTLMKFWSDKQCNRIDGTDATMFPPHLIEKKYKLYVFLQVLCRKIPLQFEKEVTILNNINVYRYRTPLNVFGNPQVNPDNLCYCQNTLKCMPSGVINATGCYNGAPIYPSFPHFFSGDAILYKDFEGIFPEKSKHQTFADIHPRFAFPISGASRIQINIAVHKGALIRSKLNRLNDGVILPLIWIEITSGDFTDDILDTLYVSTFGLDIIQCALKYGTLLTCVTSFGLIVAGFLLFLKMNEQIYFENQTQMVINLKIEKY